MDALPPGVDPSQIPVRPPPPNVVPNFDDGPSRSWAGRVAVYVTLPIMIVVVAMRFYTRTRLVRQWGVDDCLCLMAAVTIAAFSLTELTLCAPLLIPTYPLVMNHSPERAIALTLPVLDDTYGRHLWDIPMSKLSPTYFKTTLAVGIIYNFGAMFCKLTLLAFYLRIFGSQRTTKLLIWVGILVVVTFYLAASALGLVFWLPRPSNGGWVSRPAFKRCNKPQYSTSFAQGVVSAVTDFYVLLIPLVMVASLQMSFARKLGVMGTFLTGLVACGFSILGTIYRSKGMNSTAPGSDAMWNGLPAQALGVAELNLGLTCGCLPVIVPFYKIVAEGSGAAWSRLSGMFSRVSSHASSGGDSRRPSAEDSPEDVLPTHESSGETPDDTGGGLSSLAGKLRGATSVEPIPADRSNL